MSAGNMYATERRHHLPPLTHVYKPVVITSPVTAG